MKIERLDWDWAYLTLEALAVGCANAIEEHENHNQTYFPTGPEQELRLKIREHMTHIKSQLFDCRSRAADIIHALKQIESIRKDNPPSTDPSDIPF